MNAADWRLFDFVEHPIFVIESDAEAQPRYVAMNRFACELAGWSRDDVVGKTAKELYPGRFGQVAFDYHNSVFRDGLPATYELLLPLGATQRLLRTSLTPELGDDGTVLRVFGVSTDVSSEQMVDNVQLGMASIKTEMEDFISLAAHDLRAPLRSVSSIAAMLREDFQDLGDGKLELIDLLEKIGDKAMDLIGDVLSFAQLSAPGHATAIDFELFDVVNEILTMLDPWEQCHVDCDDVMIHGDRMVAQMILRNLIDNALKNGNRALERGELSLKFSARTEVQGRYLLSVEDNGGGFGNAAVLFLNGGKLKTGSGFGLLGVRRLVHARSGTISAVNCPGGIARIDISLPGRVEQESELQARLR